MRYKLFPWFIGLILLAVIFLASFAAPTVTQPDPAEKQVKATFNAPFTVHFSHIMLRSSVEENFMILPEIDGSFRWKDFRTFEFIPAEPLTIGDEYRIVIKGDARSIWYKKIGYDVIIDYLATGPPFVLFADPSAGEVINQDGIVTVMFDRPMDFDEYDTSDLIFFSPPVSGKIELFGISAFQFYPKNLKATQTYEITVPAGLSAIDGGETTEDYSWLVTTPDLAVKKSEPENGSENVVPDWPIRIHFDAEVSLEGIKPGVNALLYPSNDLDADVNPKMDGFFNTEVTYETDDSGEPVKNVLIFKPTFDYQPGEDYKFVLKSDKDLHLSEDFELNFRTLGKVTEEEADEIQPAENTEITGEGPKVQTTPALWEDPSMQFFVRGENPRWRLAELLSGSVILSVCAVPSNEYIRVTAASGWDSYRCRDTEPETIDLVRQEGGTVLNLNDYFKLNWATGIYFAAVRKGDEKIIRHFLIEDTTLLMKRSQSDLLVWALDVKSGRPVPEMNIEVLSYDGEVITQGKTDNTGVYHLNQDLDEGIYVRARLDDDEGINRWGLVADRWLLQNDGQNINETSALNLILNQHLFSPGDNIRLKGIWRELEEDVLSLPSATQITVILEDLRGNFAVSKRVPMRRNGSFDTTIALPDDLPPGDYRVSVADLNHLRLSEPVSVRIIDSASDLRLEWVEAGEDYSFGTTPLFIAKSRYKNGISAGLVKGEFRLYRRLSDSGYQKGAISYHFEPLKNDCTEDCRKRVMILRGDLEFDLKGETKILLTDQEDEFLKSGYDYDLEIIASLPGGSPVSLGHSFTVHQGAYDLALGVKHALIDVGETIDASLFALSREHEGEMIAGEKVRLTLVSPEQKRVFEDTYETESAPFTVSIPIAPNMEDGVYLLQAKSQDNEHNEILAEQLVYVSTNPLQMVSDGLLLAADQEKYFVGGRAHLLINEPSASEDHPVPVLLTYERDGLLGFEIKELTSSVSRVTVPIRSSMIPFFKVTLTRFSRGVSPSFDSVSQTLEVGDDASEIMIDLSYDPPHPEPGDEVTFKFRTYDFQNRPLSSVLTLNLTDGETEPFALSYESFSPAKPYLPGLPLISVFREIFVSSLNSMIRMIIIF